MAASKVFVIHGRDLSALAELLKFLRSLNIEPVQWSSAQDFSGRNFALNFEIFDSGIKAVDCCVVLLTPEDFSILADDLGQEAFRIQPRPNVIFEFGYALGHLGPQKTIPVLIGNTLNISDLHGVNFCKLSNAVEDRQKLRDALSRGGCVLPGSGSDYLNARIGGDFAAVLDEADQRAKSLPRPPAQATFTKLERGVYNEYVADASIGCDNHLSPLELEKELEEQIATSVGIDLKFNYIGISGARNWLNLTEHPQYERRDVRDLIEKSTDEIVTAIKKDTSKIDIVCLGSGDGKSEEAILFKCKEESILNCYYYMDVSFPLLHRTAHHLSMLSWFNRTPAKAIYADFTRLRNYRDIYLYDDTANLFILIGFTLGNYKESELLGKISEGMLVGDWLLFDVRNHPLASIDNYRNFTEIEKGQLGIQYRHALNNKFALGALEAISDITFDVVKDNFSQELSTKFTSVPQALNIVTTVNIPKTSRFLYRGQRRRFPRQTIECAFTTLYNQQSLLNWLKERDFSVAWSKTFGSKSVVLVRKTK